MKNIGTIPNQKWKYLQKIQTGIKKIFLFGYSYPPEIICFEEEKLLFLIMNKCGCTSIMKSLAYLIIGDKYYFLDKDTTHDNNIVPFKFINPKGVGKYLGEGYIIFTVIRDPLDRIKSCFNDKIQSRKFTNNYLFGILKNIKTFNAFLKKILQIPIILHDNHFKPMYYCIPPVALKSIKLLHIKNLEEDFECIRAKYNLPKIEKMNVSHGDKKRNIEEIEPDTLVNFQNRYMVDYKLIEIYNMKRVELKN